MYLRKDGRLKTTLPLIFRKRGDTELTLNPQALTHIADLSPFPSSENSSSFADLCDSQTVRYVKIKRSHEMS